MHIRAIEAPVYGIVFSRGYVQEGGGEAGAVGIVPGFDWYTRSLGVMIFDLGAATSNDVLGTNGVAILKL